MRIACCSALPWTTALAAFDAVRAFETARSPGALDHATALADARTVAFLPPPLRNTATDRIGEELFELVHLR